ncbi:MAG: hypothetical protein CMG00_09265 [Candidatus Marinimicrobia bacterium]|nr:hypothetical protein [Candidatus Neomarinimicrobiota bacterium]|tara:strand:+ start:3632 stop:5062 length:1431 start_codon:yes stop_codon:yes gene_type:complete
MIKRKLYRVLFLSILIFSVVYSNSRVAFSRPQSVYRTPSSFFPDMGEGKLSLGFSTEFIDFEVPSSSSSAFINSKIKDWNFGFTYSLLPDYRSLDQINALLDDPATTDVVEGPLEESPYEVSIHLQRRIYGYKSLYMDVGFQDITLKSFSSEKKLFDDASFFFVVSNNKKYNKYDLTINYGFGTGKIGSDSHNYEDNSGPAMSPFLSLFLNTPYFNNRMNIIFEYDGGGINIGSQIPITDIYSLRFGVSHLNKITEWGKRGSEGNESTQLEEDAPTIMMGFIMNIPDINSDQERIKNSLLDPEKSKFGEFQPLVIVDSTKIKQQERVIRSYKDSLKVFKSELEKNYNENGQLRKNLGVLQDSTKKILLDIQIDQSKTNEAMRLFQKSQDLLIEEKYYESLDVINKVIELKPNLSIAYARRGTIYYYLNDTKSASMSWNIALKLDPEYYQVRDILEGLKSGQLQPLYKENSTKTEEQ